MAWPSNAPSSAPGMLAKAKPAPSPITVPGHHISGTLAYKAFGLGQALLGTDIDPGATVVLAGHLACRHGLAQKWRQFEG
ncbi:hypothetical protein NL323_30435, partial [Klebsiella pneumoniae]|nr:hypothetical protein [Klebsiella pneumoniae]